MSAGSSPDPDKIIEPDDGRTSRTDLDDVGAFSHPTEQLSVDSPPTSPWRTGNVVAGRYRVEGQLGQGGMAHVYEARDLFLRQPVAIKCPGTAVLGSKRAIQRFRDEVALAHAVNHPNVIRTFDLGEADGLPYLSMECLHGETLDQRLKREQRIELSEIRQICRLVCDGIHAAHLAGVVHRDLKASNIMLVAAPRRVVVMDFGIAAAVELPEDDPEPTENPVIGTPICMAPEQWKGQAVDPRSDIYALGIVLYKLLSGEYPFRGASSTVIKVAHLRQAPRPVRKLRGDVDPTLAALVERCLAKDPADRPQTMLEVSRTLRPGQALRLATLTLASSLAAGLLLAGMAWALLYSARQAILREIRPSVQRLATLAAQEIAESDLHTVKHPAHIQTSSFKRAQTALLRIKQDNPEVKFIYTMRHLDGTSWEFVVDAAPLDEDKNGDGKITSEEEGSPPGRKYDASPFPSMALARQTSQPQVDPDFSTDYWGFLLSGYAPIGQHYLLGVDVENTQLDHFKLAMTIIFSLIWLLGSFVANRFWAHRLARE